MEISPKNPRQIVIKKLSIYREGKNGVGRIFPRARRILGLPFITADQAEIFVRKVVLFQMQELSFLHSAG